MTHATAPFAYQIGLTNPSAVPERKLFGAKCDSCVVVPVRVPEAFVAVETQPCIGGWFWRMRDAVEAEMEGFAI
jgi:hypothetical protein